MNKNEPRCFGWIGLIAWAIMLVALITIPLKASRSAKGIRIHFDSKGTPRLGPISLQNDKFRNLVLAGIHRVLPKTPFELAASEGAPFTNVLAVLSSLSTAGVPMCTMVTQHIRSAPTSKASTGQ